jgi:hypothetical protein
MPKGKYTLADIAQPAPAQGRYSAADIAPAQPMVRPQGDLGQQTESLYNRLTRITPDTPRDPMLSRAANFVSNVGAGAIGLIPQLPSLAKSAFASVMPQPLVDFSRAVYEREVPPAQQRPRDPLDTAPNPIQGMYQGLNTAPADTIAPMIGQTAVSAGLARALPAVLRPAGAAMQERGVGMINRTVGALKSDFKRGTNAGQGYFDANLGPSLSMRSIANKAARAHEAAGEAIGEAVDAGTGAGIKIPTSKVAAAVNEPADAARAVMNGPFGPGSAALDERMATFNPSLYPSVPAGPMEMSPADVWGMKRAVAKNVSWSDPTAVSTKQVGQQIAGGLSGVLSEGIPELRPLNQTFRNTGVLADRAGYRADTGISPLTQMGRKAGAAALGAGLGYATGHPLASFVPLALDSVPVRTSLASGLYYGGRALATPASAFPPLSVPAAAIGGLNTANPRFGSASANPPKRR